MKHAAMERRSSYSIVLVLAAFVAAFAGTLLPPPPTEPRETLLLRTLADVRVGEGRLFRARQPYPGTAYPAALRQANVAALTLQDSPIRERLRALIDAQNGKLSAAAGTLRTLLASAPNDAELLNDLGVVYLAMGDDNPAHYFDALTLFERAQQLAPSAPAPNFNSVIAYRRAGIERPVPEVLHRYHRVESNPAWQVLLTDKTWTDAELLEILRTALSSRDPQQAVILVQRDAAQYRRLAIQSLLEPPSQGIPEPIDFVIRQLAPSDRALAAMAAPLESPYRPQVIQARGYTKRGNDAFLRNQLEESLQSYDLALAVLEHIDAPFDRMWIALKRADTLIRLRHTAAAEVLIDNIIVESRGHDWPWLTGQALTLKGLVRVTTTHYGEILPYFTEAAAVLSTVGAVEEALRPQYYLALVHSMAGDTVTTLQLVYRTLRFTPADDHVRRSQLFWLLGLQLHRMGFTRYATLLAEQAVSEARLSMNPALVTGIAPYLGMIHAEHQDYARAEQVMRETVAASKDLQSPPDKALSSLTVNLLCAEINMGIGKMAEAEVCLTGNLDILRQEPIRAPDHFAKTLGALAAIYQERGQETKARQSLRDAVETIESNDAYFSRETLRIPFENQRRKAYDALISFESEQGTADATWYYAQRYRAKLFVELLNTLTPSIPGIRSDPDKLEQVQRRLPQDLQVVEYFIVEDRLLVWVLSRDTFKGVVLPVDRAYLEGQIADLQARIQNGKDVRSPAAALHQVLIDPIDEYLRPDRTLAIIPDGVLHRLNFPALYSLATNTYLIERYGLLESINLTFLLSGDGASPARTNAVAFGSTTDTTGAELEIHGLKPYYPGLTIVNGAAARKSRFLASLHTARMLHYAGHSQDAEDPLRSAVLLDGAGGTENVTAFEISQQPMPRNAVVVLASCDSSLGNSRDGIGIRGLTSAFLISGAGAVVGSLWPVEASATSRLVLAFHEHFARDRRSVVQALRQAQLEALAEGAHPSSWSGFVVTGNITALR